MINKWYQWLDSEPGSVILDGGLGFILKERGNDLRDSRLWSGKLLLTNPNELKEVAKEWLACGADIISTATYQVNTKLLQDEFNLSPDEANKTWRLSWTLLDDARQDFWKQLPEKQKQSRRYPVIAVSCGPYSAVLPNVSEYSGKYHGVTTADIRDFHLDRLRSLRAVVLETCTNSDPPNIVCFETIGNTAEAVIIAQIMGAEEFYHIPYWISFQCRDALHISCRDLLSEAVKTTLVHCAKSNLVGIGVNCFDAFNLASLQGILEGTISSHLSNNRAGQWRVDTVCYPNSGEIWAAGGWYWRRNKQLTCSEWAQSTCSVGSKIVGGCCRIGPSYIRALREERTREIER